MLCGVFLSVYHEAVHVTPDYQSISMQYKVTYTDHFRLPLTISRKYDMKKNVWSMHNSLHSKLLGSLNRELKAAVALSRQDNPRTVQVASHVIVAC